MKYPYWKMGLLGAVIAAVSAIVVILVHESVSFPLDVWRIDADDFWTFWATTAGIVLLYLRQRRSDKMLYKDHETVVTGDIAAKEANGSIASLEEQLLKAEEERALINAKIHERIDKLTEDIERLRRLENEQ